MKISFLVLIFLIACIGVLYALRVNSVREEKAKEQFLEEWRAKVGVLTLDERLSLPEGSFERSKVKYPIEAFDSLLQISEIVSQQALASDQKAEGYWLTLLSTKIAFEDQYGPTEINSNATNGITSSHQLRVKGKTYRFTSKYLEYLESTRVEHVFNDFEAFFSFMKMDGY